MHNRHYSPLPLQHSDEDRFPSGETFLDRLFRTYPLWEETHQEIKQSPQNRQKIVHKYEQRMFAFLKKSSESPTEG
jgi:hypothetical protein